MRPRWLNDLGGADPYQILEVAPDAGREEIISAHRRLVRQLHPDLPTGDAARTRLLNLARDVLLDPTRRTDYDRRRAGDDGPADHETDEPPMPADSAWDSEDVVVGAAPPPQPEPSGHEQAPSRQPFPPPPAYQPEPPYPPAEPAYPPYSYSYPTYRPEPRRESLALPIASLVTAFFCTPVGLILGLIALSQTMRTGGTGRALSIAAVAVSGGSLLCCGGYFLVALLSTSAS
jgi:hypothetical protein